MLSHSTVQKVLDAGLEAGADFAEIFVEQTDSSELGLTDSKPSTCMVGRLQGAGIRLFYGHEQVYVTTSDLDEASLIEVARTAARSRAGTRSMAAAPAFTKTQWDRIHRYGTPPMQYDRGKKLGWLRLMDQAARARSPWVVQVEPLLMEKSQNVLIANSQGVWAEDTRHYVRAMCAVTLEDQGQRQSTHELDGALATSEYFEKVDFAALAHRVVDRASLLIHADYAPAGEMPVIIDKGFGGVIFHEASGHGLETTAVAKNASVFCGKMGEQVASKCVTAIDDGTVAGAWGSIGVDDEGRPTRKTVLIENGILKSYIVDEMGARKTGFAPTGSGRRQNYKLAPASRMRNTYIAAGKDRLEDMIRDVDYGLYAKVMGGGSVTPGTGEYNFAVQEGYIIRNGCLEKPVKGATLIGRGIETLQKITRVADNLELATGMCGSVSGSIPVTVGQPAITVSSLLVGGRDAAKSGGMGA